MIVRPSIAFNDFSGTASEVTARNVDGRNILSVRAKQAKTYSPSQAKSRNRLSSISRAYKQLTKSQMAAWEVLAGKMKGATLFGVAAQMTAHNAFVRINENLLMAGMAVLSDAPSYLKDNVPEVEFEDFWVSPTFGCFTGIVTPKDSFRLFVKMSGGKSNGVSNGWSKTVIVASGVQEDWGEANVTRLYAETVGYSPKLGEKVFIELWWMDTETGFTGPVSYISAVCKTESQIEGEIYSPRNQFTLDHITKLSEGASVERFSQENAAGSALMIGDIKFNNASIVAGISGEMEGLPETFLVGRVYFPGRGIERSPWAVGLLECYSERNPYFGNRWQVSNRGGIYCPKTEIFGTSAFVNY